MGEANSTDAEGEGHLNLGIIDDVESSANSASTSIGINYGDENLVVGEKALESVVRIRHAMKRYGSGPQILNDFGMTVKRGHIYSLLGASGCGKTSVISVILGLRHLQSGEVLVFGKQPGSKGSGVPGWRVGYMPQDISLYTAFSIKETLQYYGTLYGMSRNEIDERLSFLVTFLDLPDPKMRVGNLSGGQQRRVSLSVALIHSPELIILDEPTVGVDSLLREKIWSHLVDLASEQNTSIIITTHYIEEARQSHMTGFMRSGRLLEEKEPGTLMKEHNASLLEEVVLKLSREDGRGDGNYCYSINNNENDDVSKMSTTPLSLPNKDDSSRGSTFTRIKALTLKNVFVMMRNFLLVLFMVFVPTAVVALVCVGIGNDPRPLNLGFVNLESNLYDCVADQYVNLPPELNCNVKLLSCEYLKALPSDIIHLHKYSRVEDAIDSVLDGKTWGFISFPVNFSENVFQRITLGSEVEDHVLDGSFISYRLDMTSVQMSSALTQILMGTYTEFIMNILGTCGLNPRLEELSLTPQEPILGDFDTTFREYIAISLLLGFLFFFPLCSSSIQYIHDKKLGTVERARVAGVTTGEIMIAFFVTEGIILLIQSGLTLTIVAFAFGISIKGSVPLVLVLTISMGIGGVSMGFVIASFCTEEVQAEIIPGSGSIKFALQVFLLAMATFFPCFILSGLIWPIEGMPLVLRYISYILPPTFPAESVRSIVSRGWGFTHIKVWPGFATIFGWICVYWLVTIFIHKILFSRK